MGISKNERGNGSSRKMGHERYEKIQSFHFYQDGKKTKEHGFLRREINLEMSLFLLHLGIKFILHTALIGSSLWSLSQLPVCYSCPLSYTTLFNYSAGIYWALICEAQSMVLRTQGGKSPDNRALWHCCEIHGLCVLYLPPSLSSDYKECVSYWRQT